MEIIVSRIGEIPVRGKKGVKNAVVGHYRLLYRDTPKNLAYIAKRKALGERATAELGITCWG